MLKDDQKRAAYERYGHQAYTNGMGGAGGGASGFGGLDFT
ncbi:molecular chaperone DnaJ, partial [Enterococcus faecalis]|nr:molecular chaperone DnaJ [Enterococcus faecalis]